MSEPVEILVDATQQFRVVRTSNFDKDWYNEEWASPALPKKGAEEIASILNRDLCSAYSEHFYVARPSNYKLRIGMVP